MEFKSSNQRMKVDFKTVTDMSLSQKKDYEDRINGLEAKIDAAEAKIADTEAKAADAETKAADAEAKAADAEAKAADAEAKAADAEAKAADAEAKIGDAYEEGFKEGSDSAYDSFWDAYQEQGNRSNYARAFGGKGWTDTTFAPKYRIYPSGSASYMFAETAITDLGAAMQKSGVSLIISKATRTDGMFYYANVTSVQRIDLSSSKNIENMFYMAKDLHTIGLLKFTDDGSQELGSGFFYGCSSLKNLTLEGYIGCDVDLRFSPLSFDSMYNLLWHLSPDVNGKVVYLSKELMDRSFESSEGANDGTSTFEWMYYIGCKPMWIFNLV